MPNLLSVRRLALLLAVAFFGTVVACQKQDVTPGADNDPADALAALPTSVLAPPDNPTTPAKVALGRLLFWDPILSGGRDVSCATCHHPANAYSEGLDLAIGVNGKGLNKSRHFRQPNTIPFAQRNTPTILNTAFNGIDLTGTYTPATAPMFDDLRAKSLEAQALVPLASLEEMRGHAFTEESAVDSVVARLRAVPQYVQLFGAAFGGTDPISKDQLGKALACFERSLITVNTPFDRYMRGEATALTGQQIRGMQAFTDAGCNRCHKGPMLSDYQTHVLGVPDNEKRTTTDSGENGTYAFRTQSLRNLTHTAPYMHSGKLATLRDVIDFYDRIGRDGSRNPHVGRAQLDSKLPPRGVRNPDDIIAFLEALSSDEFDTTTPAQVPSGLPVGGQIQ